MIEGCLEASLPIDLYCESTEPHGKKTTYSNIYIYIYFYTYIGKICANGIMKEKKGIILNYKIK